MIVYHDACKRSDLKFRNIYPCLTKNQYKRQAWKEKLLEVEGSIFLEENLWAETTFAPAALVLFS